MPTFVKKLSIAITARRLTRAWAHYHAATNAKDRLLAKIELLALQLELEQIL